MGEHGGGGLGGGRNRIPCRLCASRLSVSAVVLARPRSSRAAASPIQSGSRLGGRPARSRHSDKRFAAGPSGSPTAKRRSRSAPSSVLTRSILAEAVALVRARRWRSALAAGGSRRQESVKQREAGAGGEERIALPCPAARPRPGRDRRGQERKISRAQGVGDGPRFPRAPWRRRRRGRIRVVGEAGKEVGVGANHVVDFDFNVGLDTIPSICPVSIGTGIQAQSQLKPKIWCGRAKPSGSIRPRTCLSSRSLTRSCAGKCFGVPLQVWGTSRMRMMHSSRRRSRGQPVPIETEETSPQSRLKPKMSRDSLSATH